MERDTLKKFKNKNLWKLSTWIVAKSPERICDIFGGKNIMYVALFKNSGYFIDLKRNYGYNGYFYSAFDSDNSFIFKKLPEKIIIIKNNRLYLLNNDDISLLPIGIDCNEVKEVFNNSKEFAVGKNGADDNENVVKLEKPEEKAKLVFDKVKNINYEFKQNYLSVKLEDNIYKGQFYTFFLIQWLKVQIKFQKTINKYRRIDVAI